MKQRRFLIHVDAVQTYQRKSAEKVQHDQRTAFAAAVSVLRGTVGLRSEIDGTLWSRRADTTGDDVVAALKERIESSDLLKWLKARSDNYQRNGYQLNC